MSRAAFPIAAHPGMSRMFPPDGRLTVGVFFAIEAYAGAVPTMADQVELARRAEALGFAALWFRDVPLYEPSFGDVGQIHDPWVYLGHIAAHTTEVALATGGIVLPLRHPLDVAKAAASVDVLSSGRMVLGIASGDRPVEYPAYGIDLATRAERYREAVRFLRRAHEDFPVVRSALGSLSGATDLLPKPVAGALPVLAVGRAGQPLPWLARHLDGLVTYPRSRAQQRRVIQQWRDAVDTSAPGSRKPFAQSLYIDLVTDAGAPPSPIHLGYRLGRRALIDHLRALREDGVAHVILNLKYGSRPAAGVIEEIGDHVLPALADASRTPAHAP
ncbi:MAG TPA: LLM class oxidoreductase [Acidimicrobiales bacterium]